MKKVGLTGALLVIAAVLTGFGPFKDSVLCLCTDNGYAGVFYENNSPCSDDSIRVVVDNTACSGGLDYCTISGSITAYRCQDSSTLDNCIHIRTDVGSAPTINSYYSTGTSLQRSIGEAIGCPSNPYGTIRFIQVWYTDGNNGSGVCNDNYNAKWLRNWLCYPL